MPNLNIFLIRYANVLTQHETSCLRGAVIKAVDKADILFHNHVGDKFRYSYPLVQYKRIQGKAAIVCLGDGCVAVGHLLTQSNVPLEINGRQESLEIESTNAETILVQEWNCMFNYSIRKYLPLNKENYQLYTNADGLVEKYSILEKCLVGNILSFGKGLGIHFEKGINLKITDLMDTRLYRYKNVELMGFDLSFKCNVSLPSYIGLGKNVSIGYGTVVKINKKIK